MSQTYLFGRADVVCLAPMSQTYLFCMSDVVCLAPCTKEPYVEGDRKTIRNNTQKRHWVTTLELSGTIPSTTLSYWSISFLYVRVLLYIALVRQQHRNRVSMLCIGAFTKNPLSLPRKSWQHNVCLLVSTFRCRCRKLESAHTYYEDYTGSQCTITA